MENKWQRCIKLFLVFRCFGFSWVCYNDITILCHKNILMKTQIDYIKNSTRLGTHEIRHRRLATSDFIQDWWSVRLVKMSGRWFLFSSQTPILLNIPITFQLPLPFRHMRDDPISNYKEENYIKKIHVCYNLKCKMIRYLDTWQFVVMHKSW